MSQPANNVNQNFYQRVHQFLHTVETKSLDEFGRFEYHASKYSLTATVKSLLLSAPWPYLIIQLIWTGCIIGLGYYLGTVENGQYSTLSSEFWQSRLDISSTVTFGVGWALFVLLGFYISAASTRYYDAQKGIQSIGTELTRLVRTLHQGYMRGVWHEEDYERIISHLIAYPIALKMELRSEHDRKQLSQILNRYDLDDVLNATHMHLHCSRVMRGYFAYAENTAVNHSDDAKVMSTIGGYATRYYGMDLIDDIDRCSAAVMKILKFQPSAGYVNHLRLYLYIWMMFLPLSLLQESGWFTMLWSLSITYFVSKLFTIANALNDPFGFDMQDIKLNKLFVNMAKDVLDVFGNYKLNHGELMDSEHQTPDWLQNPEPPAPFSPENLQRDHPKRKIIKPLKWKITAVTVTFTLWNAFIVLLTWFLTRDDPRGEGVRWWSLYIPITTNTTSFVSVGLFLIIGFWLNDAYGRYWRGLQIWQNTIRPNVENIANSIPIMHDEGTFHQRDIERIQSFTAALPQIAKMKLRDDMNDETTLETLRTILSEKDLNDVLTSPDPFFHVCSTLYSYLNVADFALAEFSTLKVSPYFGSCYTFIYSLWAIENAVDECNAIKQYPISVAFSIHLRIFTAFWLALLPPAIVIQAGWISFAYLVPIAYAVSNLLILGDELCDPFGYDVHDIPLEKFSNEMGSAVHRIYRETIDRKAILHPEVIYDREIFKTAQIKTIEEKKIEEDSESHLSFRILFTKMMNFLPSVSKVSMAVVILWSVAAVMISWGLSKLWDDDRNEFNTHGWQSPIDVSGSVIGSMGFALFLMLAFAASDGISRYDQCARLLYDLEKHLLWLTSHVVKGWDDDSYHKYDKERLVAFLVQIPICFRNILLESETSEVAEQQGLLDKNDRKAYKESLSSLGYLINTVQAYGLILDINITTEIVTDKPLIHSLTTIYRFANRLHDVRLLTRTALSIKRFPLVGSYKMNLKVFAMVWLFMLPFSMTSSTGFYTILWVPLISLGVFGMEEIANRLVDPLGNDDIDVPVDELCTRAANSVLHLANSSRWGCSYDIKEYDDPEPLVVDEYSLQLNSTGFKVNEEQKTVQKSPPKLNLAQERIHPTLLSHMLYSVPWWQILIIASWTSIACVFSYVTRDKDFDDVSKWWISTIAIDDSVAAFMSTATFTLLGFYVNTAYSRYYEAASIWTEQLKAACHNLTRGFKSMSKKGGIHKNDHASIVGHLIALPIVMKEELKGSRDLTQLQYYLSHEEIGRIECSPSMITHTLNTLKSYMYHVMCRNEVTDFSKACHPNTCAGLVGGHMSELESIITSVKYLNEFAIPQAFRNLLDVLLIIWFILLPFAVFEISGWFTILWVPIISYSVLGIYSLATEIQHPFGTDLNDLDMDAMAAVIVNDVIDTNAEFQDGLTSLTLPGPVPEMWQEKDIASDTLKEAPQSDQNSESISNIFKLGLHVLNWPLFFVYLIWCGLAVSLAYVVHRYWPFFESDLLEDACSIWFCSKISIDSSILNYIGFALFLLLGFQLYDSHGRYTQAIDIWQEKMFHTASTGLTRALQCFTTYIIHDDDMQRLVGHTAAYPICVMGDLRKVDYKEKLLKVLSERDVDLIISKEDRANYCFDVIWSYAMEMEHLSRTNQAICFTSPAENVCLVLHFLSLKAAAIQCQEIIKNPLPFGYTKHLKIFIAIYLLLLPLGLVESSGWVSILWSLFIYYGTWGIERWANELADPFGYDLSDVPLERLCDDIATTVNDVFCMYKRNLNNKGTRFDDLIIKERSVNDIALEQNEKETILKEVS